MTLTRTLATSFPSKRTEISSHSSASTVVTPGSSSIAISAPSYATIALCSLWKPPFLSNESNEVPSVEEAARLYLEEIRRVQPTGPYFLGGYSYGGLVAYEMAQILTKNDESVAMLGIFDTSNPACPLKPYELSERLRVHFEEQEGESSVIKLGGFGRRIG
ncbi:MAG: surfactin synthase thioesterase subunit [Verrucomicrobiales bacterium]|jgi:surfactin synthase thioesterase subunit